MTNFYTYDEIKRQPGTWEKTIQTVERMNESIAQFFDQVRPEEIIFVGCGTSYYISIAGALSFMEATGISTRAVPASEIFINPAAVLNPNKQTLVVGVSRSGTTTEVVRALKHVKDKQLGETLAVTAYPDSELAQIASLSILLPHVQEKSIVMTSSFTNILLSIQLMAAMVAQDQPYLDELRRLPQAGFDLMDQAMEAGKQIGEKLEYQHYIFLGLGAYFGLACEGMLKIKEMTQVFCEAFNPLEFRHGPISVLDEKCAVVLLSQKATAAYDVALIKDVEKYGAHTVVMGEPHEEVKGEHTILLKQGFSDRGRGILYLLYLQWLAYHRTLKIGFNPDEPRNLSQVVKL